MKIEVLGGYGGEGPGFRLTCLLINDRIALDAGSLSQALSLERQAQVRSIVLSHSHLDHTKSLPFFVENVLGGWKGAIDVYASAPTKYSIRKHLFNESTWPDFTRLPNHLLPSMRFIDLHDEQPVTVDGVTFTPITVNHPVPTFGFLIEDGGRSVIWSSDTGPTIRLWEMANRVRGLRAIFVDTSFDNSMQHIADVSAHLTPKTLDRELEKLEREVPVILHHLKPSCVEKIYREVATLARPRVEFIEQGRVYEF